MYEAIKIDAEQSTVRYTNLKEGIFDALIVFENDLVQITFDQLTLTLVGVDIEVIYFLNFNERGVRRNTFEINTCI